jgi:hypothetical protein
VLVHNALTLYVIRPFQDMTWEELGGKLDDEMCAAFAVTKAVLPTMTEQGWGRFIYLGTSLSHRLREGMIALGTAKAALAQFARYLAQELGPRGITVNAVEPGPVEDTRMTAVLDEERLRHSATIGLGRALLSRLTAGIPRVAFNVNTHRPLFWFLARSGLTSLANLAGQRLAVHAPHTAPGCFARIVLRQVGLDPDRDIHTIVRPLGNYGMDLRWLHDGRIDAALVGSTMAPVAIAAEYGWQVLVWVGDSFQIPTVGVAVDPTYIHPDDPAVQAVVRAHRRALQVIHNEPDTTVQYIQTFLGRHTADEI